MKSRLKRWVLFSGNRFALAGGVLAVMAGIVLVPDFTRFTIRSLSPLYYVASALVTGNITLITVVVAINQVILSQELESPGSLRDEVERTAEYRQAALDGQAAPTEPSAFLRLLIQQMQQRASSLKQFAADTSDDASDRLATDLLAHCESVNEQLAVGDDTMSNVVVPLLGVDYSDFIHECYWLQTRVDADDEQLSEILDGLAADVENVNIARQYFTTMFTKEELAKLSRSLLYIGVLAVSTPIALLFQLTIYAGASPPMSVLYGLAVFTVLFGLAPLALLIAFVLRIAVVAQNIAAITPFKE